MLEGDLSISVDRQPSSCDTDEGTMPLPDQESVDEERLGCDQVLKWRGLRGAQLPAPIWAPCNIVWAPWLNL